MSKELKKIDLNAKSFIANGKEYFIEGSLSFERFLMYQMLQVEVGYDVSFEGMFNKVKEAFDLMNKLKLGEAAVVLHNIMSGVSNIDNRRIPVLNMCGLFMNTADEDRGTITNEMIDRKIEDWTKEGLDVLPFFQFAASSIKGFTAAYEEAIPDTLKKQGEKEEAKSQ
jgi:hypothetical protein